MVKRAIEMHEKVSFFLFFMVPAAVIFSAFVYFDTPPEPLNGAVFLRCRVCGERATRSLRGQTAPRTYYFSPGGERTELPFAYCDRHEASLGDRFSYRLQVMDSGDALGWTMGYIGCILLWMPVLALIRKVFGLRL